MIVGLTGLKGSGKDTVGAYLVKDHQFERLAFADPLKKSVAALLDIPYSQIDRMKNNPHAVLTLAVKQSVYVSGAPTANMVSEQKNITMRQFLQRYGTEAHRELFGTDFWIDLTLPVQGYYPGRAIVVTDVRFDNEAARVRQLGGVVWAVERDGLPSGDTHASEIIDFPIDYVVKNNGTFDELFAGVEEALNFSLAHVGSDG